MNKTVKKILVITAVALIAMPLFNGCKKGDEDPFLSLSSRNKRITGTWKLVKYESKGTDKDVYSTSSGTDTEVDTYTNSYDGTSWTTTFVNSDDATGTTEFWTNTTVYLYSLEVTINKDNTYSYNRTRTPSKSCSDPDKASCIPQILTDQTTSTNNDEGIWYWLDSKDKKIYIGGPSLFNGTIKQLKNKELIIEETRKDVNTSVGTGFTSTYTYEYTETSTWEKQ